MRVSVTHRNTSRPRKATDSMPRTLTLTLPYIVEAINEKLLYIFGACNALSIPIGTCSPLVLVEIPYISRH